MHEEKINQTLILPDGRTLGFAEYGDSNAGKPIFFSMGRVVPALNILRICLFLQTLTSGLLLRIDLDMAYPTRNPIATC